MVLNFILTLTQLLSANSVAEDSAVRGFFTALCGHLVTGGSTTPTLHLLAAHPAHHASAGIIEDVLQELLQVRDKCIIKSCIILYNFFFIQFFMDNFFLGADYCGLVSGSARKPGGGGEVDREWRSAEGSKECWGQAEESWGTLLWPEAAEGGPEDCRGWGERPHQGPGDWLWEN